MSEVARGKAALERTLGYCFRDPSLLDLALSHPSHAHEVDGSRGNERLEFLGDAALDLAVAQLLFEAHPGWHEGDLTRTRAALVNTRSLAGCARSLELDSHVRLGRTERRSGGRGKETILANVFEAVVGAMFLDDGLGPVAKLARRLFADALVEGQEPPAADPKTRFQEWAHARFRRSPSYVTLTDSGIEQDDLRFTVEVRLADEPHGQGRGRTKRQAERMAAEAALQRVAEQPE